MIAANPELQEREALKGLGLTASMADALSRRGVPGLTACVAADLGALAMSIASSAGPVPPTATTSAGSRGARSAEVRAATALT